MQKEYEAWYDATLGNYDHTFFYKSISDGIAGINTTIFISIVNISLLLSLSSTCKEVLSEDVDTDDNTSTTIIEDTPLNKKSEHDARQFQSNESAT